MATTVNSAFIEFNKNIVNLQDEQTKKARASRDWLISQVQALPSKEDDFPSLYDGKHINYGSFARNTKIKPLDDIDLIITLSANGSKYSMRSFGKLYYLTPGENANTLIKLCDDYGYINSRKIINKLISSLSKIDQYKSAEMHRKQEAVTLKLASYEWNFDIVPAFYTDTGYYLIPDGEGHWKATDPRIDQKQVSAINAKHNGKILQFIRTLKYWNFNATMPSIDSYLFENMILTYSNNNEMSDFFDINIISFWVYLRLAIYESFVDPKGYQGNLNNLTFEEKVKISEKSLDAYTKGLEAVNAEKEGSQEKAVNKWRDIFGENFPKYE